jgi:hypothetical protein
MTSRTEIGPQIIVCTHCRNVISNVELRLWHMKHAYCAGCARMLGLTVDVERDPKKMGGHTYQGPK